MKNVFPLTVLLTGDTYTEFIEDASAFQFRRSFMKPLSFLRSISFGALKPWGRSSEKKAVPTVQDKDEQLSGDLRSILPVCAKRAGTHDMFNLLASSLTPKHIVFRTATPLRDKECLEVEFLLQGVGSLRMMAQVQFVTLATRTRVASPQGHVEQPLTTMYSGQLELWATDVQQEEIRNYLLRQTRLQRNGVSGRSFNGRETPSGRITL